MLLRRIPPFYYTHSVNVSSSLIAAKFHVSASVSTSSVSAVETSTSHGPLPLQPVRGTHDALGSSASIRDRIRAIFFTVADAHGFSRMETPILEDERLFVRSLGSGSDAVAKEMFRVRGGPEAADADTSERVGNRLALRPEGTAGVLRALLAAGSVRTSTRGASQPAQRLCYAGPMFRHERPQRGRFREFSQLGLELVGGAGDAAADVEALAMAHDFLSRTLHAEGIGSNVNRPPRLVTLINTLGDAASHRAWSSALTEHFSAQPAGALSAASAARLARGAALRILDSKEPADAAAVASAPPVDDFLSQAARDRFEAVLAGMRAIGIPHRRAPRLVRGLDYYRHTIFECVVVDGEAAALEDAEQAVGGDGSYGDSSGSGGKGFNMHVWTPPAPAPVAAADVATAANAGATGAAQPAASFGHLGTVLAGGRYDGLAPLLAGHGDDVPAIGWAAGLERLCLLAPLAPVQPPAFTVAVLPVWRTGTGAGVPTELLCAAARVAQCLRGAGVRTLLLDRSGDVGKAVGAAAKSGCGAAVILGEDERKSGTAVVKNLRDGSQVHATSLEAMRAAVVRLAQA